MKLLAPELTKLKKELEAGKQNLEVDADRLLKELRELENVDGYLYESLWLSQNVCPTCGRSL